MHACTPYLLLQYFYYQTTLARLCPLRLTTSHVYLYKKLDIFGKEHDKQIVDAVHHQCKVMAHGKHDQVHNSDDNPEYTNHPSNPPSNPPSINGLLLSPDVGRKLVFDNIDWHQEVHFMTEKHQNVDKHCVTVMATENRVSGNHLKCL